MNSNSSPSLGRPFFLWTLVVVLLCAFGFAMSLNEERKIRISNLLNRITTLKSEKEKLKEHRAALMGKNDELQRNKVALTVDLGETVKRLEATSAELDGEKSKTEALTGRLAEVDASAGRLRLLEPAVS